MGAKLIALLNENGVEAELIQKHPAIIKVGDKEFWFRKTQNDIENSIPAGVEQRKMDFLFAAVQDEDYANAKYLYGDHKFLRFHLKDNGTLRVAETWFHIDFQQVVHKQSSYSPGK